MCLIVEADTGRYLRDGLSVEEAAPGGVDPPRQDVTVRGDPKCPSEASYEMPRRHTEDLSGFGQRHGFESVLVEQVPEIGCHLVVGSVDRLNGSFAKMF
jgi:hypothetical protein